MEKERGRKQSRLNSFKVAFEGIGELIRSGTNFRIHLVFAALALLCCLFFGVTAGEWIAVLILIAIVLCAEGLNTGIEYLCDLVSPDYHPIIKKVKDVSAGAVLITAIIAVIVGCILFIPYIIVWFN